MIEKGGLSGAHLKFTKENIAVRAYYPCDIQELLLSSSSTNNDSGDDDDDFDDIETFLKFQFALVLFILPNKSEIYQQQLDDTTSYFHRAQRLVMKHSIMSSNNKNATVRTIF